jgi:hypothetical protein
MGPTEKKDSKYLIALVLLDTLMTAKPLFANVNGIFIYSEECSPTCIHCVETPTKCVFCSGLYRRPAPLCDCNVGYFDVSGVEDCQSIIIHIFTNQNALHNA